MPPKQTDMPLGFADAHGRGGARSDRAATSSPSARLERSILARLLRLLGSPAVRVRLWDGAEIRVSAAEPVGTITIGSRASLYRLLAMQDVAFGDEYSAGSLRIDGNLVEVLSELYTSRPMGLSDSVLFAGTYRLMTRRPRLNTLSGSKANIHHHYDLGNEFYRLWLDREMQYTCAYYPQPDLTIEQAQQAKLDHVCRKLRIKPGDRVVEAGCGWGSLARHMAVHYGARVRAYNISHEQVRFASERAAREGLSDRVEYIEDDYRNIDGDYDAFVSVGMLEHVGRQNYGALGGVVDRCLRSNGRALIHSIGRNQPRPMSAWIEKRIFPGAYPPTLREMMEITEPYDFSVLDVENLRLHYARTLEQWLERYERSAEQVRAMFDDSFVRAWRLYLAGSVAAFLAGSLQLFQVVFARGRDNSVPWTRTHLYRDALPAERPRADVDDACRGTENGPG